MQKEFKFNSSERCFDLRHMPFKAFEYYIFGLKQYIDSGDFAEFDKPDVVSCFLELVRERTITDPSCMKKIIIDLIPTIEVIAKNQAAYEADIDIYGNFMDVFSEIKKRA